MKSIPVYPDAQGRYSLTPNGCYPLPFHLMNPERAWELAAALTCGERRQLGITFEPWEKDRKWMILYLDGEALFAHWNIMYVMAENLHHWEPAMNEGIDRYRLMQLLFPPISQQTAEENSSRFERLVAGVQAFAQPYANAFVIVVPPDEECNLAEVALHFENELNLYEEDIARLREILSLCDSFTVNQETHMQLIFYVEACIAREGGENE